MPLLRKSSKLKKKDLLNKFVGCNAPTNQVDYLNLYCLANGITKNSVVSKLMENWFYSTSRSLPIRELERAIAKRYLCVFLETKHTKIEPFLTLVRVELVNMDLPMGTIETILKHLEDDIKKNT